MEEGRQPNFERAAECLQQVSEEIAACHNLPAVQNGNAFLEALARSEERLLLAIGRTEERLSLRMMAMENNNVARLFNRTLQTPQEFLSPLRDIHNMEIDGFPRTTNELSQLRVQDLEMIFARLGVQQVQGNVAEKRQKLRMLLELRGVVA